MAKEKLMNQDAYEKIVKELTSYAELIRTRQNEKQSAMDSFDREVKRYRKGRISRKALASSVRRVNKELQKLDKEIRKGIADVKKTAKKVVSFASRQSPKKEKATMVGARSSGRRSDTV